MNLNIKIYLLLLFLGVIVNHGYSQDCKVKVVIKTNSPGSEIIIDNIYVGKGDVTTNLSPGNHILKVLEADKQWSGNSLTDTIRINNCQDEKNITYSFNGQVYLNSNPQDAEVFAGDSLLGFTPLFISDSISEISLKKVNYESKSVVLKDIKSIGIINLNYSGEQIKKSFYDESFFKYLLGGAVVLGAVTAYFKIKADKSYKDYQRTGNSGFLDDTHKYDLISGITFGALQINLGYFIYNFLTD